MQGLNLILLSSIAMQAALASKFLLRLRLQKSLSNWLVSLISIVMLLHLTNIFFYRLSVHITFHILPVAIVSYGPLIYAYVRSLTGTKNTKTFRRLWYPFIPVFAVAIFHAIGHDDYYSWQHITFHVFIYVYSLAFLLIAVYQVYKSLATGQHELNWVYHFLLMVVFLIVFIVLDYTRFITSWSGLQSFTSAGIVWVGFIISLGTLLRSQLYPSIFRKIKTRKTASRNLSYTTAETRLMIQNLEAHMLKTKPYLRHDLSIRQLADELDIQAHVLSALINTQFQRNFLEFVNSYRIQEARRLLKETDLKILAVALESGFSNKTSFNRTFKKFTGLSPSVFRNNHPPAQS